MRIPTRLYRLRIHGRRYRYVVDVSPPTVTVRFLDPLPLTPGMVTWPAHRRRRRRTR